MFSHVLGVGPCKSAKCKMHPHVCIYASSRKTDNVVIPYLNCFFGTHVYCCRRIHEPLPGCYLGTLGIDIFILFLFSFACSFCLDFATLCFLSCCANIEYGTLRACRSPLLCLCVVYCWILIHFQENMLPAITVVM